MELLQLLLHSSDKSLSVRPLSGSSSDPHTTGYRPGPLKLAKEVGYTEAKSAKAKLKSRIAQKAQLSSRRTRTGRGPVSPYLYHDWLLPSSSRKVSEKQPLNVDEIEEFEKTILSPLTEVTRRSHRRKVLTFLTREFRTELRGLSSHRILLKMHDARGIKRVAASLAASRISSSANYLSSWSCYVASAMGIPPEVEVHRKRMMRALRKVRGPEEQAIELPLRRLTRHNDLLREDPWAGTAILPFLTVLIMCIMMMRGIAARSIMMGHIFENDDIITITFGTRKNEQAGAALRHRRSVPLTCICRADSSCPYCHWKKFLALRRRRPGKFVFTNQSFGALTIRQLRKTFVLVASALQVASPSAVTPHSARVTGAVFWTLLGVAEATIMALGDWKCILSLRRYTGCLEICRRMQQEIAYHSAGPQGQQHASAAPKDVAAMIESAMQAIHCQGQPSELGLVVRRRKRWHRCYSAGPSSGWRTHCGDLFNPATMDVQYLRERQGHELQCHQCFRQA